MSKILRATQKLFGSTAPTNQMSEFGSLAAGTPARYSGGTITPSIIQSLSAFVEGWFSAVIGENSAAIEDMNAVCYLFAYQLCYLFQAGCAEWDAATTYFIGSMVNVAGVIYVSKTDNNLNHAVTDATNWGLQLLTVNSFSSPTPVGGNTPVPVSGARDQDVYLVGGTTSWTQESLTASKNQDVCWSPALGIFVAVSQDGDIQTSPDGVTWTAQVNPDRSFGACNLICICWSPDLALFCIIGNSTHTGTLSMTSSDGVTWTAHSTPYDGFDICWSPELHIFCVAAGNNAQGIMTSPDGITFTGVTVPCVEPLGICWAPEIGIFCSVSLGGGIDPLAMTSPDGVTWTPITTGITGAASLQQIAWSPALRLFVAVDPSDVVSSPDGVTWTARSHPGGQWSGICWSPDAGLFVAVSFFAPNQVIVSSDGINWTLQTPANTNEWSAICWSPELSIFCAVAIDSVGSGVAGKRAMILSSNVITANPAIQAGSARGQRLTIIGTDDVSFPVISGSSGISVSEPLFVTQNKIFSFLWDDVQAKWLQIT